MPTPSDAGELECPPFHQIPFTDAAIRARGNCVFTPAFEDPVNPPPDVEPGDCCYVIAHIACR